MPETLLAGLRIVDLTGEPAAMAGRILADLGAHVVRVEPASGDPLRRQEWRWAAWTAGIEIVVALEPWDATLAGRLAAADVVLATPGWPGTIEVEPTIAPQAVWVSVTPFGLDGPRSSWRASDLGVMASTGNHYATGDPDRPPLRCTEPAAYAHLGPETAFATLTALATGRPQQVDVSMQEVVMVASMGGPGRFGRTGFRGRRAGANIGRSREIWRCRDGFVSFGLRGGKARLNSLQTISRLVGDPVLTERDWAGYDHNTVSDEELRAMEVPIAAWFEERTMAELYELACATNLMLAPANSPRELYASAQLAARDFFVDLGKTKGLPSAFVHVRPGPSGVLGAKARPTDEGSRRERAGGGAWAGVRILEFGAGAAGPISTRYFAEHGATVVRIESRSRPDFLRTYALRPDNPHGLEGSDMFDALNCGKLGVTLDLKHAEGLALAKRLVQWADALVENFAPRAMRGLGLDYDTLSELKPDLVMVSACLQGQTGPHRNYPGFGGQGAALSGFNFLTGWPDREPVGPFGTITDSLAPRFVATALAAGLLHRRRTGRGAYFDLSQVEAAVYSLSPWMIEYANTGQTAGRMGNRSQRAAPHGVFPCRGDDRWVAIAVWDDDEWERLAKVMEVDEPAWRTVAGRQASVDAVEAAVAGWTTTRDAGQVADALQAAGIEAIPVADFGDAFHDPQLAHRGHFVALEHPYLGPGWYERNGFRLSDAPGGYSRSGPTLGQDNDHVFGEILGLSAAERQRLADQGVFD